MPEQTNNDAPGVDRPTARPEQEAPGRGAARPKSEADAERAAREAVERAAGAPSSPDAGRR